MKPKWHGRLASAWMAVTLGGALFAGTEREVRRLSRPQGLSSPSIQAVLEDSRGYLWVATPEGLDRYDGREFRHFQSTQAAGTLSAGSVTALLETRDGAIWAGTAAGLNRYDRQTGWFTRYLHEPKRADSLPDARITALAQDAEGAMWVGTAGSGVYRFDPQRGRFDAVPALAGKTVNGLAAVPGVLWAATLEGLYRIETGKRAATASLHNPADPASLPSNRTTAVLAARDGSLWVGTEAGLARLNKDGRTFQVFRHDPMNPASLAAGAVSALAEDRAGHVWAAMKTGGLAEFDGVKFQRHLQAGERAELRTAAAALQVLAVDAAGTVWAGSAEQGLYRLAAARRIFTKYGLEPGNRWGLEGSSATGLWQDRNGALWVAVPGAGLMKLATPAAAAEKFKVSASAARGTVTSFLEDETGTLWAGTAEEGLFRFDANYRAFLPVASAQGLRGVKLSAMANEPPGRLLIATRGKGLFRLDTLTGTLAAAGPATEADLTAVLRTRSGALWIGSAAAGLQMVAGGRAQRFEPASLAGALRDGHIQALFEDAEGTVWVGTPGGLAKYVAVSGTFSTFTERDGLISANVLAIGGQRRGSSSGSESPAIWLSTPRGVCRFQAATKSARCFGAADGLGEIEFLPGSALLVSGGGTGFGGTGGFVRLEAGETVETARAPRLLITGVRRPSGSPLTMADADSLTELTLEPAEDSVVITFSSPDAEAAAGARYRYRLEGLDSDWLPATVVPLATYTKIARGRYTFHVQAAGPDGRWGEPGAALVLNLRTPLWASWWAWILYACAGGGALFLFLRRTFSIRRRRAASRKVEQQRERALTERLRMADHSVRKTEELFRQFLDNFPGVGCISDRQSQPVFVNKAFEQLLLPGGESLKGQPLLEVLPEEVAAQFRSGDRRVLEKREPVESLELFPGGQGARCFQVTRFPIFDSHGDVALIGMLAVDVTEARQAEEMRRLQGAALESAVDAMAITALSGEVTWTNPAFQTLTGYQPEEIAGRPLGILRNGGTAGEALTAQWFEAQQEKADAWRGELRLRRKDGSPYTAAISLTPVQDGTGALTHFIVIQQDATARMLAASPLPVEPAPPLTGDARQGPRRILIADDDRLLAGMITHALQGEGFEVLYAPDGAAAVALFSEDPAAIDLVLMDYAMPELDGARAFLELQNRNPRLPILLMSARLDPTIRQSLLIRGLRAFLQKPFPVADLVAAVRANLPVA